MAATLSILVLPGDLLGGFQDPIRPVPRIFQEKEPILLGDRTLELDEHLVIDG
jgi:hypothetical protein